MTLAGYGRVLAPPIPGEGCALFFSVNSACLIVRKPLAAERAAVVVAPLTGMAVGAGMLLLVAGLLVRDEEKPLFAFDPYERHGLSSAESRFSPQTSGMTRPCPQHPSFSSLSP